MRKITRLLSVFIITGALCACVTSCKGCGHKHGFMEEWETDETSHWHECWKHDAKSDEGVHVDENGNGECDFCEYDMSVSETKITISETQKTVKVGTSFRLTVSIESASSEALSVAWESDNTYAVEVDSEGNVTAKTAGNATVTATVGGVYKVTCDIKVLNSLESVSVSFDLNGHGASSIAPRNTEDGKVSEPEEPTDSDFKFIGWYDNAECTGQKIDFGSHVFVNATTLYARWESTSFVEIEEIQLDKTALTLKIGKDYTLKATVLPANATNKAVTWSSNNTTIAVVDKRGKVMGKNTGKAEITATANDGGLIAICVVTVELDVEDAITLDLNSANLNVGETLKLTAAVSPFISDKSVEWSSDKPAVASVEDDGTVTAVGVGTARISAKTKNGGYEAVCIVTVTSPSVQKISESDFKAFVNATKCSTGFMAYMGNSPVRVDSEHGVIRVGDNYTLFDTQAKTATTYTYGGNGKYTKRTQQCESFAKCMQLVLGLASHLDGVLQFTDYNAQVQFDSNDEYTVGNYVVKFEDGKIKTLSFIDGSSADWDFITYGNTSVTLPDFGDATEEKSIEQLRSEALARLDEVYNGLLVTHTKNEEEITKAYNASKAGIAKCDSAEGLENCLKEFNTKSAFDSDAEIVAAVNKAGVEMIKLKDAHKGNYTKAANKPLFDALFSTAETFFENATSVQSVNDYFNNNFGKEEVADDETGETEIIDHFAQALAGIPTDDEIGPDEESPELTNAKNAVKAGLKDSWEEYLEANENVNGLSAVYKNKVKELWETAKDDVDKAKTTEAVKNAQNSFNLGKNKEVNKAELVNYAAAKIAELDASEDAEIITAINAAAEDGVQAVEAVTAERDITKKVSEAKLKIDMLASQAPSKVPQEPEE